MEQAHLVYTTFPDEETALAVAEALVEGGLAACVNLIPGVTSVYAWKGAVERGREVVGVIKTRQSLLERVRETLKARHPYETPIVLFLAVGGGDRDTLEWLLRETGAVPEGSG